jgi:hypothetical protein
MIEQQMRDPGTNTLLGSTTEGPVTLENEQNEPDLNATNVVLINICAQMFFLSSNNIGCREPAGKPSRTKNSSP